MFSKKRKKDLYFKSVSDFFEFLSLKAVFSKKPKKKRKKEKRSLLQINLGFRDFRLEKLYSDLGKNMKKGCLLMESVLDFW